MADPATRDEFGLLFAENTMVSGEGLDTTQHMPCPFCAAPDFLIVKIVEFGQEDTGPFECGSCGRSGRFVVDRETEAVRMEFVQTGGEPPPAWMAPPPKREEA
jgi:hypothetical protein